MRLACLQLDQKKYEFLNACCVGWGQMLRARLRVQLWVAFHKNAFIFMRAVSNQVRAAPCDAHLTRVAAELRKARVGRAEKIVPVNCNYVTDLRWRHTTSILTVAGPAPIGIQSTRNVINDITAIVSDGGWQIELTRRNGEHYQTHNFRRKRNKLCPRQKLHFPHICPGFYLSSTTESAPASVNLRTRKLIPLQKQNWFMTFEFPDLVPQVTAFWHCPVHSSIT